ncbi:MAG: hypothetical protein FJ318_06260 [SAR202 cluster bacterium]|nr:hypothetical protein [SAR202 cluster bacterium]
MAVDAKLTRILKAHAHSRSALAAQVGVSVQTIDNWCSGRVCVPLAQLQRLRASLAEMGVPADVVDAYAIAEMQRQGFDVLSLLHSRRDGRAVGGAGGRRRGRVAIIVWNLARTELYGPMSRIAREAFERRGYDCEIFDCCARHHLKRLYVQDACSLGCQAVIFMGVPGELPDPEQNLSGLASTLAEQGVWSVFLKAWDREPSLSPRSLAFGWLEGRLAMRAVRLLADLGHRRIGRVLPGNGFEFSDYHRSFIDALLRQGLEPNAATVTWQDTSDALPAVVPELLDANTAVYVPLSGVTAVAGACHERGFRWPDDVSIVTVGAHGQVPRLGHTPFTHFDIPSTRIALDVVDTVSRAIEEEAWPEHATQFVDPAQFAVSALTGGSVGAPSSSRVLGVAAKV